MSVGRTPYSYSSASVSVFALKCSSEVAASPAELAAELAAESAASTNANAISGVVLHTSDERVSERGRNAIGPVGRKRWYAVVLVFVLVSQFALSFLLLLDTPLSSRPNPNGDPGEI